MGRLSGTWPLIGRAEELAFFRHVFEDACAGRTVALVVGGPSGIGKSRLVAEFAATVEDRGACVLSGAAIDVGQTPPFWPVTEPLRRLLASDEGGWVSDALGPLAPHLTSMVSAPAGSVPAARSAPGAGLPTLGLLSDCLSALASKTPLLVVVEDLHWADRSTRDLLVYLLANLTTEPVMLLGTYRSDALGGRHPLRPFLPELGRDRRVHLVQLQPLTRSGVEEMVHRMPATPGPEGSPGSKRYRPEVLETVWNRSEGNPFIAEETLRAVAGGEGLALPATLRDVVLGRVQHLPETAATVLRALAGGDGPVDHGVLQAVTELGDAELLAAVRAAVDAGLVRVDGRGTGYELAHRLYHETFANEMLPGERQILHRRYAEALEPPSPDAADARLATRLAYHWGAAGVAGRALAASVRAAEATERIFGFAEAHQHWERAIVLAGNGAPGAERRDLLTRAAAAADLAGEHQRAVELLRAALDTVEDGLHPDADPAAGARLERSVLHQRLGRALLSSGRGSEAVAAHRRAVDLLPAGGGPAERAAAIGAYAEALLQAGAYREARAESERALVLARAAGSRRDEAAILATLGFSLAYLEDPDAGVAAAEEGCRIAEAAGDPDAIGRSLARLSDLLGGPLNRMGEAVTVARRGWTRTRELGVSRTHGVVLLSMAANALFRSGDWREAGDALAEALAERPTGTEAIEVRLARARLLVGWGDFEQAEDDLGAVDVLCVETAGPRYRVPLLTLRAGLEMWRGRPELARRAVATGLEEAMTASDDVFVLAPIVWHGMRAEADIEELSLVSSGPRRRVDELSAIMDDLVVRAEGAAPSVRDWVVGYLELSEAERSRAERGSDPLLWARAAQRWERRQHPYPAVYSRMRQAEALLVRRSARADATAILRGAAEVARAMGARPLVAEMEQLARRARVDLAADAEPGRTAAAGDPGRSGGRGPTDRRETGDFPLPAGLATLTQRELGVLAEIAEGRTNREIASRLFISEKTTGTHVSHILAKLGVRTRGQAAAVLHRSMRPATSGRTP